MIKHELKDIPSEINPKDWHISRVMTLSCNIPRKFMVSESIEPLSQGSTGSCVPHSLKFIEDNNGRKKGTNKEHSIGMIYCNRLATDWQFEGMIPRQALNRLLKDGNVEIDEFPYNEPYKTLKSEFAKVKSSLLKKAKVNKIKYFVRLYSKFEIKNALMKIGPVTMSMRITTDFYNMEDSTYKRTADAKHKGFHQMTVVGWDEEGFIVLNSWGSKFGSNGTFKLPYSEMRDCIEFWGVAFDGAPNIKKTLFDRLKGWFYGKQRV